MSNLITFTNKWDSEIDKKYYPRPAIKDIPLWYRDSFGSMSDEQLKSVVEDYVHPITGTIKQCIPVMDSITSGYLIYSPVDLIISQLHGEPYYEWYGDTKNFIEWHPKIQAGEHPEANTEFIPKWINPWSISTLKGYSCLFTHPLHRDDLPFKSMSGIVDTDKHISPVNFVFTLKDPKFTGLIPAGTPIVQVFPFKRESWEMKIGNKEDKEKSKIFEWKVAKHSSLRYKHNSWTRKDYK
jgi:hypothetical protein